MLLKILKLAGIDVEAQIAVLKADLELKAKQATERLTDTARRFALIAGCFGAAAILALFAMMVGLIALYQWTELTYGPFVGLAVVGAILVLFTILLTVTGLWMARSETSIAIPNPASIPSSVLTEERPVAPPTGTLGASTHRFSADSTNRSTANTEDLFKPVLALIGRYVRTPATGYPVIDDLLRHLGSTAQGTTNDALTRAANLIQTGDRTTMIAVLGSAALFGWLLVGGAAHDDRKVPA